PERFQSFAEYQRHVDVLINAGLIDDTTKIWWDLRPSGRFPTLETRIMDVCTRLDDAIALVSLLVCILRMLYRLRIAKQAWRIYAYMGTGEDRGCAMRYGFDEGVIAMAKGGVEAFADLLDELSALAAEDGEALGCGDEVAATRTILEGGTSAHR